MSPALRVEWDKHQSNFTSIWLGEMRSRRRIEHVADITDGALERQIRAHTKDARQLRRVLDDIHLITTARQGDRTVASEDDEMRRDIRQLAPNIGGLRGYCWVNPSKPRERCLEWLAADAPCDVSRRVG